MDKIAIVTDSTCDIDTETLKKYDIRVIPLRIIYKRGEYIDGVDITPDEIYNNLHIEVPSTSLPAVDSVKSVFDSLVNDGYNKIIVFTISSGLSGTNNFISMIASEYNDPNVEIKVFDTKSISMVSGFMAITACEMVENGSTFEEILNSLEDIKKSTGCYFIVSTLKYLKLGGRIGAVSGTIGELLNIKPLISVNEEGIYYTVKKIKGKTKALSELISHVAKVLEETKCRVCILQGGAMEEAKHALDALNISKFPNLVSIKLSSLSPVAGVHAGPGFLGIAYQKLI